MVRRLQLALKVEQPQQAWKREQTRRVQVGTVREHRALYKLGHLLAFQCRFRNDRGRHLRRTCVLPQALRDTSQAEREVASRWILRRGRIIGRLRCIPCR